MMQKEGETVRQFFAVILLAACIGAGIFLPGPHVSAQAQGYPIGYELLCPTGSMPLSTGGTTYNLATGKFRAAFCIDTAGNITANLSASSTIGGSAPATVPVNLATQVTGVLPVANEGTGTPAAGKYVDGATGAWTALPTYNGSTPNGTYWVTSDQNITSTSFTNITGLSWTMPANAATNSAFHCDLIFSGVSSSASYAFGIQDVSVAPTNAAVQGEVMTATAAITSGTVTGLNTTTATSIVSWTPSTGSASAWIAGLIEQPSNASSSVVNIMSTTTNASYPITIKRGSFCRVF